MLTVYNLTQAEEWDSVVRSFRDYDVYWLSGYVKAFQLHGDGEPLLFYCETDGGRGVNVVMKRDIAKDPRFAGKLPEGRYFDFATPYGYGGWLIEGEHPETMFPPYVRWCQESGVVSEFARFHPTVDNASLCAQGPYKVEFLGNTVALKLDSEENIWERFSSKNRGHIRKAMKEGVTVRKEQDKAAFDTFRRIYETTMDNDDASSYYYFRASFFDSIRQDLDGHCLIFTAYLGEEPIASSIMLFANGFMNYHLSGQLFSYRKYAGTNSILYEAAKWGCANGCQWLHLGGGLGAQEGSLYTFKKSFNAKGEDKKFYVGKAIFQPQTYETLMAQRRDLPESAFFPRYRA